MKHLFSVEDYREFNDKYTLYSVIADSENEAKEQFMDSMSPYIKLNFDKFNDCLADTDLYIRYLGTIDTVIEL